MTSNSPKPRQPKLRSSCDACGAAKLKCDRDQPECSRCILYGINCHYGVSRKMGKPRRDRTPTSCTTQKPALESTDVELTDGPASWDMLGEGNGNGDNLMSALDTFDQFCPSLLSSASSVDLSPFGAISTPGYPPHLANYCMSPAVSSEQKSHPKNVSSHSCDREVNTTLENLSMLSPAKAHNPHHESQLSSVSSIDIAMGASFDHGLCVTRQVIERLSSHFLTCPCAAGPSLALLYASGISRILAWYQQAACAQGSSVANASSASDCGGSFMLGSMPSTDGFSVAPTTMAVGTFNVDDSRVQSALRIQLLLGEMRRAGRLIELFINTHADSGQQCQDGSMAVDGLYSSLGSWLRNEHYRIGSIMRGRLRELNMLE